MGAMNNVKNNSNVKASNGAMNNVKAMSNGAINNQKVKINVKV